MTPEWIDVDAAGRRLRIEYAWVTPQSDALLAAAPLVVFLHEGLGSVSMWRDFPQHLCDALGARGLVYSRPGYGSSTPRAAHEHWPAQFMHQQAYEVLPAVLRALNADSATDPPWLFGHSDGGSIALLFAAKFAHRIAGAVVLAPHIMVEDISRASVERARQAYVEGALRQRLAQHHDDPDSAFWGWSRAWLAADFKAWSIEPEIAAIRCPLLAVQGVDDEYGTLEQIRGIARRAPQAQLLELAACGHAPQRDQPEALIAAVTAFMCGVINGGGKRVVAPAAMSGDDGSPRCADHHGQS